MDPIWKLPMLWEGAGCPSQEDPHPFPALGPLGLNTRPFGGLNTASSQPQRLSPIKPKSETPPMR